MVHQVKNAPPSSDRKWQKEFMGNSGIEIPTAESIVAQMREEWDSFLADWTAGNKGFGQQEIKVSDRRK